MLGNRLDRRKTGATSEQHNRPRAVLAQEKRAERRFDAQDVALLDRRFERAEQPIGKYTSRCAPDMQFDQMICMRRGRDRILAARAVLQNEIQILAGTKLQSLVGRQLQRDHRDVGRGPFDLGDARRHLANRNIAEAGQLALFDHDIAQRTRRAKAQSLASSSADSADDECVRCTSCPATNLPRQVPHAPFLHPYGRPTPLRSAAFEHGLVAFNAERARWDGP